MKLIIQIPCYNEAETLPGTIADLPQQLEGIDVVEVLVIDDGSEDGTAQAARDSGANHVVRLPRNRGLAIAFATGLETSLQLGADIIVNTDGDNQYPGRYIHSLVAPILAKEAEMVVGDRQVGTIPHFSWIKKLLQRMGSMVVRWASGTGIPDATSGFRAFSKEAALKLEIYSDYTYTLETIIQAGKKGLMITSVPVTVNPQTRESRLISNIPSYVLRSTVTILRIFLMYEALRAFTLISIVPFMIGTVLIGRFLYYTLFGPPGGHVQSLIIAAILLILSFLIFLLGLIADLIARNRKLSEEINYHVRKMGHWREERSETKQM